MQPVRLPDRPLNCLHLGDSYTIGEGVALEEGWPFQLHELLEQKGLTVARAHILARTGWTTGDLLEALQSARLDPEWDFITLCIGVNNQYRGLEVDILERELPLLLAKAKALRSGPDAAVILLGIPDWGVSPFAADRDPPSIAAGINRYNRASQCVAERESIPFFDWSGLTREFAGQPEAFAADALHPSARQYAAWALHLCRACRSPA